MTECTLNALAFLFDYVTVNKHIFYQCVKISQKRPFVFEFTSLPCVPTLLALFLHWIYSLQNKNNKNAKALRVHSVIYWSLSINGHRIFRWNMYQMHKIPLFSTLADQIWTYLLFFKHSYTTSGFGGHIGFLKKTVI